MPWYNDLRSSSDPKSQNYPKTFPGFEDEAKLTTIENLLKLRQQLLPVREAKQTNQNIILGSWNIKEFGYYKNRIPPSYFYIAEIISCFDLIALQEIKFGLKDLNIIMRLLGKDWTYIINDITEGKDGNNERSAYLYDTRRVKFSGLAGEIVIWKELLQDQIPFQLKRTPYMTGFQAGWKSFALINLHLHPGNKDPDRILRKQEIQHLTEVLDYKVKQQKLWSNNLVLIGDFNLYQNNQDHVQLFNNFGFFESDLLENVHTNIGVSTQETYDRIFFRSNEYFRVPSHNHGHTGGVIDIFDSVYTDAEFMLYKDEMQDAKGDPTTLQTNTDYLKYFRDYWRKYQLSDHKPIWVEVEIDSSDAFLKSKKKELEVLQ